MPEEASTTSPGQIPAYLYIFDKHPMGLSIVETYFNALPSLLLTIILLEDLFFFLVLRPRLGPRKHMKQDFMIEEPAGSRNDIGLFTEDFAGSHAAVFIDGSRNDVPFIGGFVDLRM